MAQQLAETKKQTHDEFVKEWNERRAIEDANAESFRINKCNYHTRNHLNTVCVCGKDATHKHISGAGLCHKHFNKTDSGKKSMKPFK